MIEDDTDSSNTLEVGVLDTVSCSLADLAIGRPILIDDDTDSPQ